MESKNRYEVSAFLFMVKDNLEKTMVANGAFNDMFVLAESLNDKQNKRDINWRDEK